MEKAHTTNSRALHIGTAGWTIPRPHAAHFPGTGTHLERCAQVFNCVEINSSFYRPHQLNTWQRWAACTPPQFRFSVKLPKTITHTAELAHSGELLQRFFDEVRSLGDKLGPVLIQLPPKLQYDEGLAHEFFTTIREVHPQHPHSGYLVLEPRHKSWFTPPVDRLLRSFEIARAAADPPKASPGVPNERSSARWGGSPLAATPGGWNGLSYWRLHGSPRTYYSAYDPAFLEHLAQHITASPSPQRWIIFDNTALGHATTNALDLMKLLQHP